MLDEISREGETEGNKWGCKVGSMISTGEG